MTLEHLASDTLTNIFGCTVNITTYVDAHLHAEFHHHHHHHLHPHMHDDYQQQRHTHAGIGHAVFRQWSVYICIKLDMQLKTKQVPDILPHTETSKHTHPLPF
jgi:hypothetical protein